MKKFHRIIFCIIWFVSVLIPYLIMRSHVKFPSLDSRRLGWLIPIFFVLPVLSLLLSIFIKDTNKICKTLNVFYYCCASIYIIFLFVVTFGFRIWIPILYPICSETTDSANYLIIEDTYEFEYRYINFVFPAEIPQGAEDIEYHYYCNVGFGDYKISAKWKLQKEQYQITKENTILFDENIIFEDNILIYVIDSGNDKYTNEIHFNDKENTVAYYIKAIS